jgi:ribosomal protein S18 acetylase RimI-like enzyme
VIRVISCNPGLEKTGLQTPNDATAVNEVLHNVPHLGYVEFSWNRVPVGKNETDVLRRMLAEVCLEGSDLHAIMGICSHRYMQPEIEFRPLLPPDYDQVVALWMSCDGVEVAEGDDRESFTRYLDRNPGLSHVAIFAGAIVGAALCGHDGRRGLVYHLAVAPAFRGQGIGKKILKLGLDALRENGIARVIILVAEDNSLGQEFWISQGFEHIFGALPLGLDLS